MTGGEAIRQASILVSVLLADGVITEKEAEILREALEQPEQCDCKRKTSAVIEAELRL